MGFVGLMGSLGGMVYCAVASRQELMCKKERYVVDAFLLLECFQRTVVAVLPQKVLVLVHRVSSYLYVFNNLCHHILDVQACGTHLLRDETGGRHARRGIDFQQVYLVAFGDDVVNADDAVATQDVVYH